MKEQCLSAIAVLNIECDLAKKVDMDELVDISAKLVSLHEKDWRACNKQQMTNSAAVGPIGNHSHYCISDCQTVMKELVTAHFNSHKPQKYQ